MNQLTVSRRALVVATLVEGNSLRATARITGIARMTIEKLLRDLGSACAEYQNERLRDLGCRRMQLDEIWSFVYAKQKKLPQDKRGQFGFGDVWTWVAVDADSKLVPSWLVGPRDAETALAFVNDLAGRLRNRIQLTTDGLRLHLAAVEDAFGGQVDYSMLVKLYRSTPEGETRYSPAKCIGTMGETIVGFPDPAHVSTSYAERRNLTMRMHMRRFTRLTNAFSKKVENHTHAVALHFMHYNFVRVHQPLRATPAMAAGVTHRLWEIKDLVAVLDRRPD